MRFCTYCGQPLDPVTQECPVCGGYRTQDLSSDFIATLKSIFRSPLMLLMCIFSTASVLIGMFNSDSFWMYIFNLMLPISLWVVYFSACTSKPEMPLGGFRFASIIFAIIRVLIWICLALLLLLSIIIISVPSLISEVISYAVFIAPEYEALLDLINGSVLGIGIILLFAVLISGLVNALFFGAINKSIKSIINSFNNGENQLCKFKSVKIWLITICVFYFCIVIYALSLYSIIMFFSIFIGALLARKIQKISV